MMSESISKKMKLSKKGSGRSFQDWWTEKYGVVDRNDRAQCSLCDETIVSRTWNVKRHFDTNHQWLLEKSEQERKEYILQKLKHKQLQSDNLVRFVSGPTNLVSASFSISHTIVQHGKALSDGDFIKEAFVNCAPFLFDDMQNKDSIIKRINDLPVSRNAVKDRVMAMGSEIENQVKKGLNACEFFSICLDQTTDATSSARLAIIARYSSDHVMYEELVKLETLALNTTGSDVCVAVVNMFRDRNIDITKIVSVTTDGAPNMVGQNVGFVKQFEEAVGHPLVSFHCIIHQEVLCAKVGLKELNDVMTVVTKTVNLIAARALHKQEFKSLLNEVESVYNGLFMHNNVRWLSRGQVLERFVECLNEIKLFLDMEHFPQLNDVAWLSRLMFFSDLSLHLNELDTKLQGFGKTIDIMFSFIKGFESKLNIFKCDFESRSYKYFPRLKNHFDEISCQETNKMEKVREQFYEILNSITKQFSTRFRQFRELERTINFIKYPDEAAFTNLKLDMFEWLDLDDLEMQLVQFQTSLIWKQKFIDLRSDLEEFERNRLHGSRNNNSDNEILKVWNHIPETFDALKRLAKAILTIFSSTYSCETVLNSK